MTCMKCSLLSQLRTVNRTNWTNFNRADSVPLLAIAAKSIFSLMCSCSIFMSVSR